MTTWVFPLAGQSNMVSRADADGSGTWPDGVRFVTQKGEPIVPAAEIATPEGNGGPFLIAKCFARDFLAARPGDGIVFVPGAVGGTSFWNHRWNPGDDLYDNLVALTKAVLGTHPEWRLRALLFQGFETDAKNGMPAVNARDRIGSGPWYNARGQMIARDLGTLHGDTIDQARVGNALGKQISLSEKNTLINGVGDMPNQHDILTGSRPDGTAFPDEADHTCNNYTSNAEGGSVQLGHHDRGGGGNTSWNSAHPSKGCSQPNLVATGGAGLLYCFATN